MADRTLLIGILGLILILAAFLLEEFHKHTRHESITYNAINFVGAFFLSWYAWILGSWPFLILNAVWTLIALYKLQEILRQRKRKKRTQTLKSREAEK